LENLHGKKKKVTGIYNTRRKEMGLISFFIQPKTQITAKLVQNKKLAQEREKDGEIDVFASSTPIITNC